MIACSGAGPCCSVKTFVSGTATASAARIVRLGGSSFVVKASSERKVRIALTGKARRLLKRRKAIPSKVRIVVSRAGQRAERTIRVRLRPPSGSARDPRPNPTPLYQCRYSPFIEGIAELIRNARLEAGLSQVELAARAGTSQPAVARYEQAGSVPTLATLERLLGACGRRAIVSSGASEALVDESAAPSRSEALRQRRDRLLEAAARRGIHSVRVFGSVRRGQDRHGSDVDLLVDLSPGWTLLDLVAFRREAGEVLGSPVDVATPDMLEDSVREAVLADAAPL